MSSYIDFEDVAYYLCRTPGFKSVIVMDDPCKICVDSDALAEEELTYMVEEMSDDVLGCEHTSKGYVVTFVDDETAREFADCVLREMEAKG